MISPGTATGIALAITRAWLRFYTCGLPPDVAEARCAEIESDLWEMLHDAEFLPRRWRTAIAIERLIGGMADDLAWRFEHARVEEQLVWRQAVAFALATIVVLGLWSAPRLFYEHRADVSECARAVPKPLVSSKDFEIIRCVGPFFYLPPDVEVGSAQWQLAGVIRRTADELRSRDGTRPRVGSRAGPQHGGRTGEPAQC